MLRSPDDTVGIHPTCQNRKTRIIFIIISFTFPRLNNLIVYFFILPVSSLIRLTTVVRKFFIGMLLKIYFLRRIMSYQIK